MTLIIASVQGAIPEHVHGADLLEIRIDSMSIRDAIEQIPAMLQASPLPTIVTCRSVDEGGSFYGEDEERIAMYAAALQASSPPRYIDIEHEILVRNPTFLDALALRDTSIILSWHDTMGRPRDLLQRAEAMQSVPGIPVVKIVWRARSIRDNLEAFELLRTKQKPMIAMCMGPHGLMSRVLAPKFGGFATYAAVEGHAATAAGQITINELLDDYRFMSIDKNTAVYGVIGDNVANSASPAFHNAAFGKANRNAVYFPFQIPGEWEHLKASVLELINHPTLDFSGASVTIPHKEDMLRLVKETKGDVSGTSAMSGASNTICVHDGVMRSSNTDIEAIASLAPQATNVLVLGGGGVARAAITAMATIGATVFVAARNEEQVARLTSELDCQRAPDQLGHIDTLINCTPVGMKGGNDPEGNPATLLAPNLAFAPSMRVIDTVYIPIMTPLLQCASDAGCSIVTGEEIFTLQAQAQQKEWSST